MDITVFLAVMVAATLHATWNAIAKSGGDKVATMGAVVFGHVPFAVVALIFADLANLDSLPYLVAGAILHTGYQFALLRAYQSGELSCVYPISRGSAPILVAVVSVLFLGQVYSVDQMIAIICVCVGVFSFIFVGAKDGQIDRRGVQAAMTAALFIASYSLVDGLGARIAGTALGFYAGLSILNAIFFALVLHFAKPGTSQQVLKTASLKMIFGGGASFMAYAIVIWAFTQAPIALVAALRESSIIMAVLIGSFVLKERLNIRKVVSTAMTVCGVILVRLAK